MIDPQLISARGVARLAPALLILLLPVPAPAADMDWSAEDFEFFELRVRPVLATQCSSCHSESNAMSGLRLDSRDAVLKGGSRGPAASIGDPDASLLIQAVRHDSLQMPLGGRLPDPDVASLEEWVRRGLPWAPATATADASEVSHHYESMRRQHWAFQPFRKSDPPPAEPGAWSENPIDRFVKARLDRASLEPNQPAARTALLRRLSFVLTGLPPSPREVQEYLRDTAGDAYERAVERLLASKHFGEGWARHWMDIVRFGETLGNDWNYENNGAWLYRDYLIRAFNADVPYDQLIREHIAGDLLEDPRIGSDQTTNESLIGTFFFRLGEQGHDDCTMFREVRTDVVDDQIDTLGKAFQGLTIACARCHDHKLDPIPTADYYGLYGVLDSSRMVTRTVDTHDRDADVKRRLRALKPNIRTELAGVWLAEAGDLASHLAASTGPVSRRDPIGGSGTVLGPERAERIRDLIESPELQLSDPLFPWKALATTNGDPTSESLAETWTALKERYRRHQRRRTEFNDENFDLIADFGRGAFPGWHLDGLGFEDGTAASGEFSIAPGGNEVVSGIFPSGIYTHLLTEKLNGAIRSPYLPRDRKYLSLRVLAGKLAAWRTVLDNCMLSERYQVLDQDRFGWIKIPLRDEHDEYRIYAELVTKHDNPRLPDRPDRMKGIKDEQMAEPRSFFGVTEAVLHDCDELPEEELTHVQRLFEADPPGDMDAVARRYASVASAAVKAWNEGAADADDVRWLQWLLDRDFITNSKYLTPTLRESVDLYRTLERKVSMPRVVQGLTDMEAGRDAPIFRFGDPTELGDVVPRGFLSLLDHMKWERPAGSGRLEVAELIASPRNPLTARVLVNRIWHYMFGRGLVPTVDNLGRFGERPSHPELLDYLASQFVEDGWSIKQAIRRIALSQTFRQASDANPAAIAADPGNELFHRFPARRLEAESIRDSILAVSGKLDRTMHGPSIHPFREKPKAYRKLLSGPLDGDGRRSIYLKVTRHEGAAFLEALDFPAPAAARGRRDATNVPKQALTMMNDPFVVSEARFWAEALIEESSDSARTRLTTMYRRALGRPPTSGELDRMESLAERFADLHGESREALMGSVPVWQDIAHSIFNLKEFIYIR